VGVPEFLKEHDAPLGQRTRGAFRRAPLILWTPLTPDEIAAYKALTAYAPDTVVQASDGAGVKLDYQRDVNIVIKKLEDAIASIAN